MILGDVNDFILPNQACVNPFVGTTNQRMPNEDATSHSKQDSVVRLDMADITDLTTLQYESDKPAANIIKPKSKNDIKIASVSLTDCLACSGCVTSVEAVLIQEQSYEKLFAKLQIESSFTIVTLSPQSVSSIAHMLGLSLVDTFVTLSSVLKYLGVKYVFDASSGGDVALIEAREEFMKRYRRGKTLEWSNPPYSMAVSSSRIADVTVTPGQEHAIVERPVALTDFFNYSLPMICSHCPGWVCFAEKKQPQSLQYISTTKSSQQIIGSIFKTIISKKYMPEVSVADIYHVAIMPCFDKKLEATRKDFFHDDISAAEVDMVLSTVEFVNFIISALTSSPSALPRLLMQMPLERPFEFLSNPTSLSDPLSTLLISSLLSLSGRINLDRLSGVDWIETLFRCASVEGTSLVTAADSNGGSGGYFEYLYRYTTQEVFGKDIWNVPLKYVAGRNDDFHEVTYENDDGKGFKFARAYGFRNIQSVMMKTKRFTYDFVEMMACPKGCINGGGQYKSSSSETPIEMRSRVAAVRDIMGQVTIRLPDQNNLVLWLYGPNGINAPAGSIGAMELLHTSYHAIPKLEDLTPMAAKW